MTRIEITHHAVERFVQRHRPDLAFHEAKRLLIEASKTAVRMREKTWHGQAQYRCEEPAIVLVVKDHERPGDGFVCVTVLPVPPQGPSDEEVAERNAAAERRARYFAEQKAMMAGEQKVKPKSDPPVPSNEAALRRALKDLGRQLAAANAEIARLRAAQGGQAHG